MERRRILLVEDEEAIFEPLAATLRDEGFEPVLATTASEGLVAFHSRSPDLVLLDVLLPDGDGRDVLRAIRALSRVPVVMLTVRGDELDKVVGLELGADDYITKRFATTATGSTGSTAPRPALTARTSETPGFEEVGANWYWDGVWKTPIAWADYLARTNDVAFVSQYFHDDAGGSSPWGPSLYTMMHTHYLSQLSSSTHGRCTSSTTAAACSSRRRGRSSTGTAPAGSTWAIRAATRPPTTRSTPSRSTR
ncbi:MAG TPA: response regulator [Solirubrobacteraceae bacterium]